MCKAALERFTTGLASEVYADGIAVNALSPSGLVPTPGVVHHQLTKYVPEERHEPPEVMAEAALALVSGDPAKVTGLVTYSRDVVPA
jgi:NAD(P)-dependent dehydrogenase (short-subunit alcohol dehydrogenase family)